MYVQSMFTPSGTSFRQFLWQSIDAYVNGLFNQLSRTEKKEKEKEKKNTPRLVFSDNGTRSARNEKEKKIEDSDR